jgi:K+-sensing histidine kinase KdpD
VCDHGDGVDPDQVPQPFERFPAHADQQGSVALGLWSTQLLVEAHGGSLTYRPGSPEGKPGVVFSARLPTRVSG